MWRAGDAGGKLRVPLGLLLDANRSFRGCDGWWPREPTAGRMGSGSWELCCCMNWIQAHVNIQTGLRHLHGSPLPLALHHQLQTVVLV